ncbi:MAG: type II secretion system protein N [Candidatus Omnitrophota bacterium]
MFKKIFTVNLLIKLLLGVIIVSLGITAYAFFFEGEGNFEKEISEALDKAQPSSEYVLKASQYDYSKFLSELTNRKVFLSPYFKEPQAVSKVDRQQIGKVIENLRLAGIKSGKDKLAIIEDKRAEKVFYLKENDSFLEGIKIEKIKKDSIILNYQGEKYELYL